MGLVTSSGFANQTITFLNKETTIDENYNTITSYRAGADYSACVYSKALSMGYFDAGLWKPDTLYVAMIDYVSDDLSVYARVMLNDVVYAIDYIDDIAFQHEAIFIGLKAVK